MPQRFRDHLNRTFITCVMGGELRYNPLGEVDMHILTSNGRVVIGLGLATLLSACQGIPWLGGQAREGTVNGDFYANVDASGGRAFTLKTPDGQPVGDVQVQIGGMTYRAPGGVVSVPQSVAADAKVRARGFVRLFIAGFVPKQVWLGQQGAEVVVSRFTLLATEPYVPASGGTVRAEDGAIALQIAGGMLTGGPTSVALSTYVPAADPTAAAGASAQARTDFLAKVRAQAKGAYHLAQAAACTDPEAPLPCAPPASALGLLVTVNGPMQAGRLTATYDLDALALGDPQQAAAAQRILRTFSQIDADPAAAQFRAALQADYGISLASHTLTFNVAVPPNQQTDSLVRLTVAGFDLLGVQLEVTVESAIGTTLGPAAAAPGQADLGSPTTTTAMAVPAIHLADPNLVAANTGSPLISNDGGSLIGNDGAGLISNDGAGLISNDGAGLISNDGGSIAGTVRTPFLPSALIGGNQKYQVQQVAPIVALGAPLVGALPVGGPASYTEYPFPNGDVSAVSRGGLMQFVQTDAVGHYVVTSVPPSNPFIVVMAQCGTARLAAIAPAPHACAVTTDVDAGTTAVTLQVMDQLNRGIHRAPEFSYANYQADVGYYRTHLSQAQAQGMVGGLLSTALGLVSGVLDLLLASPYQLTCWVAPPPPPPPPAAAGSNTGA
ncbi:MAG: hypothetical protein JWM80_2766, partial [Cyanobacteria bacterium RYN_339]|nr:hypothetical protein [Cyanobacteria bacterium RYN_339]